VENITCVLLTSKLRKAHVTRDSSVLQLWQSVYSMHI